MEYTLFKESSIWQNSRKKRVISFARIGFYSMMISGIVWIPISIIEHLYLLTFTNIASEILAIYALWLLKNNKESTAKFLLLFIATFYISFIYFFYSGYGIADGGTVHLWFIVLALFSYFLLYDQKIIIRESIPLVLLMLFILVHFGFAPTPHMQKVSVEANRINAFVSAFIAMMVIYFITRQFVLEITKAEQALAVSADKLEGLVESMLPKTVAERLRKEGKTFADEFHDCSVLFADIVGFTAWSENHHPNEVVDRLNNIFSKFDELVEEMKLTKIKTMGDSYMVASGIPEPQNDHAVALTRLAIKFNNVAKEYDVKFRIGINSGSVVAGVIGKKIFIYDLWGDTVNVASRMESHGEEGKINVPHPTYLLIKDKFQCTHRGKMEVKNKGKIDMYFVDIENS